MTDKPDIIDRLKRWAAIKAAEFEGKDDSDRVLVVDLDDAIAEIAYLRRVAGAVSRGESHADIRDKARKG